MGNAYNIPIHVKGEMPKDDKSIFLSQWCINLILLYPCRSGPEWVDTAAECLVVVTAATLPDQPESDDWGAQQIVRGTGQPAFLTM